MKLAPSAAMADRRPRLPVRMSVQRAAEGQDQVKRAGERVVVGQKAGGSEEGWWRER